jgi:hypothetical protein
MVNETDYRFYRVRSTIWFRIAHLDDIARELALYIMTCRHNTILGCYYLPISYICEDLKWFIKKKGAIQIPDVERAAEMLQVLEKENLIKYDYEKQVLLLIEHFDDNPLQNANQVKAAIKCINELPKSPLFRDLKELTRPLVKPFMKPLEERLEKIRCELEGVEYVPIPKIQPEGDGEAPVKKFTFEPVDMELAEYLKDEIKKCNPHAMVPSSLDSWADTIRMLRTIDERPPQMIKKVITWAQEISEFWRPNILSAKTLREKFSKLVSQMVQDVKSKKGVGSGGQSGANTTTGTGRFTGSGRTARPDQGNPNEDHGEGK